MHCLHCGEPIEALTIQGYGTVYAHINGWRECEPTYATPRLNFD